MTNAIEVTKREMYEKWNKAMGWVSPYSSESAHLHEFKTALEAHLEELRKAMVAINESTVACAQHSSEAFVEQERRLMALTTERDTLRNRVQVLELANQTSGDVIRSLKREAEQARKALMVARLTEFAAQVSGEQENVSSAPLGANTATILGALVDAQRIMTDYLVPDGIRAKDAMGKLIPVLDNETLFMALRSFEQPEIVFGKDTIWVWTKPHCMHSFHPAFPSGELCTFCGVGK